MRLFRKRKRRADPPSAPTTPARSFQMAAADRLTADWAGSSLTLNQMLFSQMGTIRKRARDLAINSPWARRFLAMARTNVVGPNGFSFFSRAVNPDGSQDVPGNREIERLWRQWGKPGTCTMCGKMGIVDLCNQVVTGLLQDGEVVLRLVPGADNPFGFAVAALPVDLLDHNLNRELRRDGNGKVVSNAIKLGIEVDEWDRPVAYWFRDGSESPLGGGYGSQSFRHVVYPATGIIHLFPVERPGQVRGFSFLAPAGTRTKMLNAYEEAAVVHKRISASKMGFLVPDADNPPTADYTGDGEETDGSTKMNIEPGIVEKLPLGYKFDAFDVDDVSDGFADFSKQILRSIASAWNVNYNTLANDLSEVNYSSIRHGALEDRDAWMCIQRFLVEHMLERIYPEWLKWTLTTGNTFIYPTKYEKFLRVGFQGRRWTWIDPLKEETANQKALENGTTSRHQICRALGIDYDDILAELKAEAEDRAKFAIATA